MAITYSKVQELEYEHELRRLDGEIREVAASAPTYGPGISSKAMQHWLQTGQITGQSAPGVGYETKAALVENAAGQVLIPLDLQADILAVAREQGTIRELAEKRPTNRNKQRAGMLGAATVGWGRLETGTTVTDAAVAPGAAQDIEVFDLVAQAQVGLNELDDTPEAARQAIIDSIASAIVDAEDAAFAAGSGSGQPAGLSLAANVARIAAGNKTTAAASATPTTADILGLPWKLPTRYRRGGTWLFSEDAAPKIAALTYAAGNGLMDRAGEGVGPLGWPYLVIPGLPSMATAGVTDPSVWFVNLRRAYRIVDRGPMSVQRLVQRYADAGLVGMLVRWRVGGDLVRPDAAAVYLL